MLFLPVVLLCVLFLPVVFLLPVVERSECSGSVVEYAFVVEMQISVIVVCGRGGLFANAELVGSSMIVLILLCDSTG